VLGAEFRVTTLARVIGRDATSVEQACEDLAREQLWLVLPRSKKAVGAEKARYAFSHAIFRQVLYERTARLARAQLHRAVGETLELERRDGAHVTAAELAMHFERAHQAAIALRHYADAAQAALQHLTPMDSYELAEHALSLLDQVPAGADRDSLEITLATLYGVAAFQVLGVVDDTKRAFRRAYALLDRVPQHPMRGLTLHGFGWVLSLRAEYDEALAVAKRAESLASSSQDPALLLAAATVQGTVHMLQGRPREARTWIERVLGLPELIDGARESFAADPVVTLLAMLGLQLLHLGLVQQGRQRLDQALARAHEVRQPMARLVALWYGALFELRLGRAAQVKALANEMWSLVEKFSLSQGRAASHWFRGWADARLGLPREGYDQIRAAHEDGRRFGMTSAASENLGYAAEALLLAGDLAAARHALDEALSAADDHSERIYLPQLLLLEARIAEARGEHAVTEASIRRAVAEARSQGARWLELVALLQLCESRRATAADKRELGALLDDLPEAAGTDAAARARALLGA
jgi:tetratricopeptide (TPR) repeat protein